MQKFFFDKKNYFVEEEEIVTQKAEQKPYSKGDNSPLLDKSDVKHIDFLKLYTNFEINLLCANEGWFVIPAFADLSS